MKCFFCNEPCHLDSSPWPHEVWACNRHPHKILHRITFRWHPPPHNEALCEDPECCPYEDYHATIINWPFRGQIYNAHWHIKEDKFTLEDGDQEVLKLQPVPQGLTPESLDKKLRTYILFS